MSLQTQTETPQTGTEAIRAALAQQERTVRWAALKIGCSPSHLHRVLEGERPLTPAMGSLLANLLGVPAALVAPPQEGTHGR